MQISVAGDLIELKFRYDEELINRVKTIPGRRYNPEKKTWSIPKESLAYFCEAFDLSQGCLYPDSMSLCNRYAFFGVSVDMVPGYLRAEGPQKQITELSKSLIDLCSFDENNIPKTLCKINIKNRFLEAFFPKGLTFRIKNFLNYYLLRNFMYIPEPRPHKKFEPAFNGDARPYQQEAAEKILAGEIPNGATLVLPTGAGKTFLAALICHKLGVPTLFCTYSVDLALQARKAFSDLLGCEIGYIAEGKIDIKPISVATVQTLMSRLPAVQHYLNTVDLLFVDEGHMLGAETVFKTSQIVDAYYTYALTATPKRTDGKDILIEAGSGPAVIIDTDQNLIQGGYVLPVEILVLTCKHGKTYKDIFTAYRRQIVNNASRNQMLVDTIKDLNKKTLVLVKYIKHGEILSQMLDAPFLHGKSSPEERKALLDSFAKSDLKILIASDIFKQGIDIPECEALVLAHAGSSEVSVMQKIGRARRPSSGKEKALIVDIYDLDGGILETQSKKRLELYKEQMYDVKNNNE